MNKFIDPSFDLIFVKPYTRAALSHKGAANMANLDNRREMVKKFLVPQLATTGIVSLLFIYGGPESAKSALIGGLIALFACNWQALKIFRPYRAQDPAAVFAGMVGSEISKLLLIGSLFALVFHSYEEVKPVAVFIGFIVVYMAPWLKEAWDSRKSEKQS